MASTQTLQSSLQDTFPFPHMYRFCFCLFKPPKLLVCDYSLILLGKYVLPIFLFYCWFNLTFIFCLTVIKYVQILWLDSKHLGYGAGRKLLPKTHLFVWFACLSFTTGESRLWSVFLSKWLTASFTRIRIVVGRSSGIAGNKLKSPCSSFWFSFLKFHQSLNLNRLWSVLSL